MGYLWAFFLLIFLLHKAYNAGGCDLSKGSWVPDESYPLYEPSMCPFIEREFSCHKNGRPDLRYTQYRWQPLHCKLTRFNGEDFLRRMRGKIIMFVGDSLSRNQWKSLICMLHSAVPNAKYNLTREVDVSTFELADYRIKVMLHHSVYLVDRVREKFGKVLKLDSIKGGKLWKGVDMLIFNTWNWWNRNPPTKPWNYMQIGKQMYRDMDRMVAFEKALNTWAGWVESNIDPRKSMVFFQGISPSHYNGSWWNEPRAKSCVGQKQPMLGPVYPGGLHLQSALDIVQNVLSKITKPVKLLDVTNLSVLRKDGHPSIYGMGGPTKMDCTHWCLPGVPDTWNQILYNYIL